MLVASNHGKELKGIAALHSYEIVLAGMITSFNVVTSQINAFSAMEHFFM